MLCMQKHSPVYHHANAVTKSTHRLFNAVFVKGSRACRIVEVVLFSIWIEGVIRFIFIISVECLGGNMVFDVFVRVMLIFLDFVVSLMDVMLGCEMAFTQPAHKIGGGGGRG